MILQLPLGIIHFSVFITLIVTALFLLGTQGIGPIFNMPVAVMGGECYYMPDWLTPVLAIGGVVLATATMHLARWVGRVHGGLARALLVSD